MPHSFVVHLTPGIEQIALVAYAETFARYSPFLLRPSAIGAIALSPEHKAPLLHHIARLRSMIIR
jgi:hypothetical protein